MSVAPYTQLIIIGSRLRKASAIWFMCISILVWVLFEWLIRLAASPLLNNFILSQPKTPWAFFTFFLLAGLGGLLAGALISSSHVRKSAAANAITSVVLSLTGLFLSTVIFYILLSLFMWAFHPTLQYLRLTLVANFYAVSGNMRYSQFFISFLSVGILSGLLFRRLIVIPILSMLQKFE